MSVSPASSRAAWHTSQVPGPGRPPVAPRRPTGAGTQTLTVTFSIPLTSEDALTPPARRLLDAACELLEHGEGTVAVVQTTGERRADPPPRRPPTRNAGTPPPTGLHILAASRSVLRGGEPLPLTRLEFDLLLHLAAHPRRVFTRLQLLAAVWGYEHAGVRTVDVHIRRLRSKVGVDVPLVTTVYGVGYRLADDAAVTLDRAG